MESIHYTIADPQMIPADMLDVILPEDMYRFNYRTSNVHLEDDDDVEEDDDEYQDGVVAKVSRFVTSPFRLMFYLLELLIEEKFTKFSYEKY